MERLARLVFPAHRFDRHDPARAERLVEAGVGGFCLYGGTAREVGALTAALQRRAAEPLLFCADYERGVGGWVKDATSLPANMAFGAAADPELARQKGRITAREAKALGVDWVLAPVVDLAGRADNPIVNVRAFAEDPALAAGLARAYLKGLAEEGAAGCLKHFPGHGSTSKDSHLELPSVERGAAELERLDLAPYRELAAEAPAVMVGHLVVPAWDPARPASLSPEALRRLRALGFGGAAVSDALSMGAVGLPPGEASAAALEAGLDLVLVEDGEEPLAALRSAAAEGRLSPAAVERSLARLSELRAAAGLGAGVPRRAGPGALRSNEHLLLAGRLAGRALCLLGPLPFTLGRGSRASYLELGGDGTRGRPFLERLRRLGAELVPEAPGASGPLVAAVFAEPKAFRGTANLPEPELARLRAAAGTRPAVLVLFGSPHVAAQAGLPAVAAFSDEEPLQQAAAGVLSGREEARGRLPFSA